MTSPVTRWLKGRAIIWRRRKQTEEFFSAFLKRIFTTGGDEALSSCVYTSLSPQSIVHKLWPYRTVNILENLKGERIFHPNKSNSAGNESAYLGHIRASRTVIPFVFVRSKGNSSIRI